MTISNFATPGTEIIPFPSGIESKLDNTKWAHWLSPSGPLVSRNNSRNIYAGWLSNREATAHGVYLWLWPKPSGFYRLFHVGISRGASSTMAIRTKTHCRNAFVKDQVYMPSFKKTPYGTLGPELRRIGRADPFWIEEFLKTTRVMYLTALEEKDKAEKIKSMEGVIYSAAARLLNHCPAGQWELTNDSKKVKSVNLSAGQVIEVGKWLNKLGDMVPSGLGASITSSAA